MFRAKFLAVSERSVPSSSAAGADTTSTQVKFSEIVQLACCDVHVRNSPPSVPQAPKGVDDGGAAASVVSSRGVCGGVVAVRFTILFPLHVMFASHFSALVEQLGAPKVCHARDPPWSKSDHLICALKMLAIPRTVWSLQCSRRRRRRA